MLPEITHRAVNQAEEEIMKLKDEQGENCYV